MPRFPRPDKLIAPSPSITATDSNDITIKLGDNAGAKDLAIQDSDGAEVATIDSNGAIITTGVTI